MVSSYFQVRAYVVPTLFKPFRGNDKECTNLQIETDPRCTPFSLIKGRANELMDIMVFSWF